MTQYETMTEQEKQDLITKIRALKIGNIFDLDYLKKVEEAQKTIIELIEQQ